MLSTPRSVVYQQSSKESATLQPFFTLQLDIQSDKIRTVQDALESLVARESVQGYTTKTKQEVCSLSGTFVLGLSVGRWGERGSGMRTSGFHLCSSDQLFNMFWTESFYM